MNERFHVFFVVIQEKRSTFAVSFSIGFKTSNEYFRFQAENVFGT